jgi:Ca2+-binding RTX toxin-like protein
VSVGDTIYGTPCPDTIVAPPGVAEVKGGGGDDVIVSAVNLASAPCPEECRLGIGSQTFEGGPGDDVVFGERGNDRLFGGEGNDRLYGGIGDDQLRGGPGDDLLSGGFGADSIDGQEGNDYVRGDGTQDEIVDRGGGTDTLSYSTGISPGFFNNHTPPVPFASISGLPAQGGERGVYIDLTGAGVKNNGDNGVAQFGGGIDEVEGADFEVVIGTAFSDYMVGSNRNEAFYGGGGGDVVLAGGGDDKLFGGAEGDQLDGGLGSDAIDGGPGSDRCVSPTGPEGGASCERGAGEDGVLPRDRTKVSAGLLAPGEARYRQLYLNGSDGDDDLIASYSPAAVTFTLGPGSTAPFDSGSSASEGCNPPSGGTLVCPFSGSLDSIVLSGFGGDDSLEASSFPSSVAVVISGGEGEDSLVGGDQSEDVLADGTDTEGGGDDVLEGGDRDDALLNNGGSDELFGGSGNDLFLSTTTCDGDALDGGPGRDNASWAKFQGAGVVARLDQGRAGGLGGGVEPQCASGALNSLTGIEDLEGSSPDEGSGGNDVFYGDGGDNQLLGWEGEDIYAAGGGEDRILANSGDYDPRIECGEGNDTAFIDFPVLEPHDAASPDCEQVHEAAKNSFRIETELEVPPQEPPVKAEPQEPTPPTHKPRPPKTGKGGTPAASCLGVTRSAANTATVRCAIRPRRVTLGDRSVVKLIHWRLWSARRATGFGQLAVRGRAGHSTVGAKILLSRAQRCRARSWYTRIRVLYGHAYRRAYLRRAISPTPCAARLRRDGDRRGAGR